VVRELAPSRCGAIGQSAGPKAVGKRCGRIVGSLAILLLILGIGAALVVAATIYQAVATAADQRRYPPPGRMVDIGARSLHLIDKGSGLPVIFESGISATSLSWTEVRSKVEGVARACSYDRAWLGWSHPAPSPRTTANIVDDLHALLEAARIPTPVILTGHSFGGMLARAYAGRYPGDVAGLVLLDPLSPGEWLTVSPAHARMLRLGIKLSRRGAWLARLGVVRASLALLIAGGRRVPQWMAKLTGGSGESVITRLVGEVRKMPPETWPMVRAHWCLPRTFQGLAAYLESLPASSAEAAMLAATLDERLGQPGAIPVTELSAANATPQQLQEREAWTRRSPRGRHIIARKSGHWIQLDEPELVVQAIQEMLGIAKPS
jgi:pimeloyl-ACP methyl ester carboxylesterase